MKDIKPKNVNIPLTKEEEEFNKKQWAHYLEFDECISIPSIQPIPVHQEIIQLNDNNWEEVAESRLVSLGEECEIDELHVIELVTDSESFRFATLYNFSVILGKPKSRKSTFITLIISEILKSY